MESLPFSITHNISWDFIHYLKYTNSLKIQKKKTPKNLLNQQMISSFTRFKPTTSVLTQSWLNDFPALLGEFFFFFFFLSKRTENTYGFYEADKM